MTEKEKCEQGLLYNANHDPELIKERELCKDLFRNITTQNIPILKKERS